MSIMKDEFSAEYVKYLDLYRLFMRPDKLLHFYGNMFQENISNL